MRILALERDLTPPPYVNLPDLYRAEAAAVWDLQQRGIIREIWFAGTERRAVLMLECADAAEARAHLAALPLARYGRTDFTLLELRPYDGLERLFTAAGGAPDRSGEPPEY